MDKKNIFLLIFVFLIIFVSYFIGVESTLMKEYQNNKVSDITKEPSLEDSQKQANTNIVDTPDKTGINLQPIEHNIPVKIGSTSVVPGSSSKLNMQG